MIKRLLITWHTLQTEFLTVTGDLKFVFACHLLSATLQQTIHYLWNTMVFAETSFLSDVFGTITIIQVFTSLFFAVLFLQSGSNKIIDRMGNIEYISRQFAESPMEKFSIELLTLLTVLEMLCGLTCLAGAVAILFYQVTIVSFYGMLLAAGIFLFLFTAQRLAKDYAGAVSIVSYFMLSIIALFFMSWG